MRCPRCDMLMRDQQYEGETVFFCDVCFGHWLTREQLKTIITRTDYDFSDAERQTVLEVMETVGDADRTGNEAATIVCPLCEQKMLRKQFHVDCPVQIDECPQHGIWLDSGEIKDLQVFAESRAAAASAGFTPSASAKDRIGDVLVFVTNIGAAKLAEQTGSKIQRRPPKIMFPQADQAMGLGGALVRYAEGRTFNIEQVPEMDDDAWAQFLSQRLPGRQWLRWYGKTSVSIYTVVVAIT